MKKLKIIFSILLFLTILFYLNSLRIDKDGYIPFSNCIELRYDKVYHNFYLDHADSIHKLMSVNSVYHNKNIGLVVFESIVPTYQYIEYYKLDFNNCTLSLLSRYDTIFTDKKYEIIENLPFKSVKSYFRQNSINR